MKKILVILGGGRPNGNTAQLVNSFAKGAEESGHYLQTAYEFGKNIYRRNIDDRKNCHSNR